MAHGSGRGAGNAIAMVRGSDTSSAVSARGLSVTRVVGGTAGERVGRLQVATSRRIVRRRMAGHGRDMALLADTVAGLGHTAGSPPRRAAAMRVRLLTLDRGGGSLRIGGPARLARLGVAYISSISTVGLLLRGRRRRGGSRVPVAV